MPRWLKIVGALVMIVVLAVAVDWKAMPASVQRLSQTALAVAFAGYAVQFLTSAWKWQWSLRVHAVEIPLMALTKAYCASHFVGQFLPTAVGGDAYRVYRTWPMCHPQSRALSAIVVDRLVGLAVLLGLGTVAAIVLADRHALARTYLVLAGVGLAAALVLWQLLTHQRVRHLALRITEHPWGQAMGDNLRQMRAGGWSWMPLVATSMLFQSIAIGILWTLFAGVGAALAPLECAIVAAVAGLATMIPLSINGIGIVDGSIAGTAVLLGASYEDGILVAVLVRLIVLPLTIACGLLYAAEPKPAGSPSDRG